MEISIGVIVILALGLALGSFLNVCITRLPQGESIAWPGSHCRSCNHALPWYLNIPALSWLALRGRCAYCKERIPVRYLVVELGVALAFLWIWFPAIPDITKAFLHLLSPEISGSTPNTQLIITWLFLYDFASSILVWLLIGLIAMDWEETFLSDWFTIPGTALGLLWTWAAVEFLDEGRFHILPMQFLIATAFAGFFFLIRWLYWLVRRQEGLGLGDVKLAAMIGAWLGWGQTLVTLFLAVIGALLYATFLAIRKPHEEVGKLALPFGSFLAGAAIVSYFEGTGIWLWYLRLWHLA